MTRCVILQPSYIPWRGYFHQVQLADAFIFLDDVQYDKNGWRNRNRIKSPNGPVWLTIPVRHKGAVRNAVPINEIPILWNTGWNDKHLRAIEQYYAKAPNFNALGAQIRELLSIRHDLLADYTIDVTKRLASMLGITTTRFFRSSEMAHAEGQTDRLISLLQEVGATEYLSGPSARAYLDEGSLAAAGITVGYMAYEYPEYPQLFPPYEPAMSVIDLLLMVGDEAPRYIWP